MGVRIVFCFPLDRLLETKELDLDLSESVTLESLFAILMQKYPALKEKFSDIPARQIFDYHITVVINRHFAWRDALIRNGDTVKFFSPFTGG